VKMHQYEAALAELTKKLPNKKTAAHKVYASPPEYQGD